MSGFTPAQREALDARIGDMVRLIIGDGEYLRIWNQQAFTARRADAIEPKEQSTMSEHETQLRLECLRLAERSDDAAASAYRAKVIVETAQRYYDFITGADRAALAEEAKAAVDQLVK